MGCRVSGFCRKQEVEDDVTGLMCLMILNGSVNLGLLGLLAGKVKFATSGRKPNHLIMLKSWGCSSSAISNDLLQLGCFFRV